jgi:uncharacterized protein YqjF (DUF2071 family)
MELKPEAGMKISIEAAVTTRTVIRPSVPVEPDIDARKALQHEPDAKPVMYQTWSDLLFLHWEWDPSEIQALLPPGLLVDTYGAKAYVAVTPFFMKDVRASFLPPIPGTANFMELNVRTYVYDENGIPGVWFFSLDCNQSLAVLLAKAFYSLPYHSAEMEGQVNAGLVEYSCKRNGEAQKAIFRYRKETKSVGIQCGSLPFFLVERFLLYSYSAATQKLYRARIHHAPWEIFHAQLGQYDETMLRLNNLNPKLHPPQHAWAASPVRVKIYALEEASRLVKSGG